MTRRNTARKSIQRFNRDDWLSLALETLSKQGKSKLTIDRLVADLGVTKGSFYWHFENRADFIQQLLEYWAKKFTYEVVEKINTIEGDAGARLFCLMELLSRNDASRYDIAVRAWAAQEPAVAIVVRRVDMTRLGYVKNLFRDLGFDGDELTIRSRAFLYWASFELGLFEPLSKQENLRMLEQRFAFFYANRMRNFLCRGYLDCNCWHVRLPAVFLRASQM